MNRYYLGIDPGYARLGFGIVSREKNKISYTGHGVLETEPDDNDGKRLLELEQKLVHILQKYPITSAVIEQVFFRKDLTTGVRLIQARGMILLTLARFGIPVSDISPSALKKSLTGNGRTDKKKMQSMITKVLHLEAIPAPDDAADGLALAISAALRRMEEQRD